MPLFRTPAVVLRARDLGEHDRLVSLYSRDLGRFTAVARGARRLRSRFGGALELFTWGEAVGFEREGRDLLRLDHFDIQRSFRGLREDLERIGHGARVIEAIVRLTAERDPQPSAFALLTRTLRELERARPARVQLAFALRFLDLTGHRPRLDRCAGCGRPVGTDGIAFDPGEGGVRCDGCRVPEAVAVSARALGALRGLQAAAWEARLEARIPAPVEAEAATVLDGYISALSGSALRTPRFLARTLAPPELW
jgi:DNA repair protein RecO (recombination protein O)